MAKKEDKTLKEVLADETLSDKEKYDWYINHSREWKVLRNIVLARDNHHCTCCGRTADDKISGKPVNLTIHHNSYKALYHEMDDLTTVTTLCQLCHNQIHSHLGNKQRFKMKKDKK